MVQQSSVLDSVLEELKQDIGKIFPRKREYIFDALSDDELRVCHDNPEDAIILAKLNRTPLDILKRYDEYTTKEKFRDHYHTLETRWMWKEFGFLESKLGREPTSNEFIEDFRKHNNGLRFRAFYVMKFPDRVQMVDVQRPEEAVL